MIEIRREVLNSFKKLHRTRQLIFNGDDMALSAGRKEINDKFKKNKYETKLDTIKKMLQLALDVEKELRTNVIQAKKKDEGVYEVRITPHTTLLDNFPFNADAVITPPRRKVKSSSASTSDSCCDESASQK